MLGTRLGITRYPEAVKLTELLDRYGICFQTFNNLADFVIDLYERGIITEKETRGLALRRDFDTARTLIGQIMRREGFGDILAGGWLDTLRNISSDSERYAVIIKGDSLIFDPRMSGLGTMELEQVISPGGPADASIAGSPTYMAGQPLDQFKRQTERIVPSKEAFDRIFDSPLGFNVGRLTRYAEDFNSILACLGICSRAAIARLYNLDNLAELYSAATGIESSPQQLLHCTERTWNLHKAISVREGFSRKDDTFPDQWFLPMKTDGDDLLLTDYYKTKILTKEDLSQFLDDYYEERGWEIAKGIPTQEKLIELGLDEVAKDLAESGYI
jgi:aldehyde:ferredoxin oxidoreductase